MQGQPTLVMVVSSVGAANTGAGGVCSVGQQTLVVVGSSVGAANTGAGGVCSDETAGVAETGGGAVLGVFPEATAVVGEVEALAQKWNRPLAHHPQNPDVAGNVVGNGIYPGCA